MLYRTLLLPVFLLLLSIQPASAQSEPYCDYIDSIPAVITESGRYCLEQSARYTQYSGAAIVIKADDVFLDLREYSIKGNHNGCSATKRLSEADGIVAHGKGITIVNGVVNGFRRGVAVYGPNSEVSGMRVAMSRMVAIAVNAGHSGAARIGANTVSNVGGNGCTTLAAGIHVVGSNETSVSSNQLYNINTQSGKSSGIFVQGKGRAEVRYNHLSNAGAVGIDVNVTSSIHSNVVRAHSDTRQVAIRCSATRYPQVPVIRWRENIVGGYDNPTLAEQGCDFVDGGLNEILN